MTNKNNKKDELRKELDEVLKTGGGPKAMRFALACLGAVPVAGGAISGIAGTWSEQEQKRFNKIFSAWLKLQEDEIKEIGITIMEVMVRLDQTNEKIRGRIESPEYLKLIKKSFRDWSAAESEEKRVLIRNLLANAASTQICSDNIIRLFIEWISRYSEGHFAVLREVYKNPGITRGQMWQNIYSEEVREDSAEADLFRLIVHDLSLGRIIRQHREFDYAGRPLKQKPTKKSPPNHYMKSAFDDTQEYELTELGNQFVHYTMNEMVPKIEAGDTDSKGE